MVLWLSWSRCDCMLSFSHIHHVIATMIQLLFTQECWDIFYTNTWNDCHLKILSCWLHFHFKISAAARFIHLIQNQTIKHPNPPSPPPSLLASPTPRVIPPSLCSLFIETYGLYQWHECWTQPMAGTMHASLITPSSVYRLHTTAQICVSNLQGRSISHCLLSNNHAHAFVF